MIFVRTIRRGACVLLAALVVVVALPAAGDYRRGCQGLFRVVPHDTGLQEVNYPIHFEGIANFPHEINGMRAALRDIMIDCVYQNWRNRYNTIPPQTCTHPDYLRHYPFASLNAEITRDFCAANRGHDEIPVEVILEIRGQRGCVRNGGNLDPHEHYVLVDRYPITCNQGFGEGHDDDVTRPSFGEGHADDVFVPPDEPEDEPEDIAGPPRPYQDMPFIRLPGNDIGGAWLGAHGTWTQCLALCRETEGCNAWTFRGAGTTAGRAEAGCLLKSGTGLPVPDTCCHSGIMQ